MGWLRRRAGDYRENLRNFRGSGAEKARLVLRNRALALARGCCGHHGEPGC